MSITSDVQEMRKLFWRFYYGEIALFEMQVGVAEIMNRQRDMFKEELC